VRLPAALTLAALLSACAGLRPASTPVGGYLDGEAVAALAAPVSPPPVDIGQADQTASDSLRMLEDADRWWLATAQSELRPPEAGQHFDCALGIRFAERPRPALTRLMKRLLADSLALTGRLAKDPPRPRPVALDAARRPCQRLTTAMRASSAWPVGPAVAGAAYAEMFAALAPDRAIAARRIGHEIGVSRAVCGMAWPSDIPPAEALGREVYAAASTTPGFAADLEAARTELEAARAEQLTSPACAAERLALSQSPF
jgi:acid phosphatase (class A)